MRQMKKTGTSGWRAALCMALALAAPIAARAASVASSAATSANETQVVAGSAAALRAQYAQLRPRLESNAFGAPVHLVSREASKLLQGEVYGVVNHPFQEVDAGLADARQWCEILILPFNTKNCTSAGDRLSLYVGKKALEPIERAYRLDFRFVPVARAQDYLERSLRADEGPLGTRNYAITLEAAPLDEGRTFIHLSYSYES